MPPETYHLAADRGIGVLAFSSTAPSEVAGHIRRYKEDVKNAQPVGAFVNDQWANFTIGHCGDNNAAAQELGARAVKSFFGPDRPYTSGRNDVYKKLLEAWGGVPDHLKADFERRVDLAGGGDPQHALWEQLDAGTLCERGVIIDGDAESCIEGARRHEESGADQVIMVMQTDEVPHDKDMRSIELFGEGVIPAF